MTECKQLATQTNTTEAFHVSELGEGLQKK